MFDFTDFNKRVLSVAFFWFAMGTFICAVAFTGYRIFVPVGDSSFTTIGVVARALFLFAAAGGFTVLSRYFFVNSNAPGTPMLDSVVGDYSGFSDPARKETSETAPREPASSKQGAPAPDVPEKEPAPALSKELLNARQQPPLTPRDKESPLIQRVLHVLAQSFKGKAILLSEESIYPDDEATDPTEFAIQSSLAGGFTDSGLVDKLHTAVTKSIPKGIILWGMAEKTANDRLVFTKKKRFPKMLFPEVPDTVVTNKDEAYKDYEDKKFVVGEDAFGNKIEIDPKKSPHGLVVGGTGSGKSVFTLGLIEDLRVSGWQIVIVDGKRTDYTSLIKENNVVAVGGKLEDWIRLTQFVEDQMEQRYAESQRRQINGIEPRFPEPPMLFLLDEFGTVIRNVKGRYGKPGVDAFFNILKNIAAKARQAKIHMVIATQDVYANTFDGDLRSNLSFIVSLGKAEQRTLQDAFSNDTRSKAVRIGQSIQDEDKGRGIIEIGTDEGKSVVEFQTYFAYSPGEPPQTKGPAVKPWEEYKEKASDKIPLMYPRMWYEEPDPEELSSIESIDVLRNYRMLTLTNRKGQVKDSCKIYDVLDPEYIGRRVADTGNTLLGFDDDDDDAADYKSNPATAGMVEDADEKWASTSMGKLDSEAYEPISTSFKTVPIDED